ncbi:MAG: T9SS type A sorting domain-containing protein, partial [Ignavibacteria bacterium]|nr:T9SS type A sorting domain-containing protein [Ignavibacteria bacterium]
ISFDSTFYGFNWSLNNCISGTKDGVIFIADPGFDDRGLFRSTDNGINWSQQIFSKKIWTVFSDESGLVLGGGKDSLWYSSDFGGSWLQFSLPLKEYNKVTDIKKDLTNQLFFSTDFEGIFELDVITNIGEEPVYSYNYSLSQNYPNPFNPVTKIKYSVPSSEIVQIKVFDVLGTEIKTLLNEYKQSGSYEIEFDASSLPSGVYFYRVISGSYSETKKMILLR